jgi:splicing factor U2AF subunit
MGRSRSKEKKKDKDKDRKRSRSGKKDKKEKRSRSRKAHREMPEPEPAPMPQAPVRARSPDFGYRRWRFDSPPKEEEYARDAMLTGNPMGLGGVAAALAGGLGGVNTAGVSPLTLAADTKALRELYVGNLPAGINSQQLSQFLNQVAQAVKVNSLPGEPVLSATMGGGGLFAFVEFRTAEEAANGLRLNGVELLGCQLKVGRPKGYTEGQGGTPGLLQLPGAPGQLALPGAPGQGGAAVVSAIDHRLCLINIPTFVSEERIRELLITFGQLKFFALQKDQNQKSVGVAFFEYNDMMTQQQARAALEGLELGAKKLSVKRPEEVISMGLVAREQKLGNRVVACKVLYLKNIVTPDDLRSDASYQDICADIRLEAEKFGPVVSLEVPRSRGGGAGGLNALENPMANMLMGGTTFALTNEAANPDQDGDSGGPAKEAAKVPDALAPAPLPKPDENTALAIINKGQLAVPGSGGAMDGPTSAEFDATAPGIGYAFIEFANIEGASKAKKALHGRRFGSNDVEVEYFSEDRYYKRDFANPTPNQDEPKSQVGLELALVATEKETMEEAPVMAD